MVCERKNNTHTHTHTIQDYCGHVLKPHFHYNATAELRVGKVKRVKVFASSATNRLCYVKAYYCVCAGILISVADQTVIRAQLDHVGVYVKRGWCACF